MTSLGPYNETQNYTHMFDIKDFNGPLPHYYYHKNSMSDIISCKPEFSKFRYILEKAKLDGIYNDPQSDYTIFVPTDNSIRHLDDILDNLDYYTARNIIRGSTLNRKITSPILEDSRASYFITIDPTNRLLITNVNGDTYINNTIKIIQKDILCTNGVIHVIDNLILPVII